MSGKNAVELFVEALSGAIPRVLAEKSSAAWSILLDEPSKSFPADTPLLNFVLVASPSKAEAAIQIAIESALLLTGSQAEPASVAGLNPEQAEAVRGIVANACNAAAKSIEGLQVHVRIEESIRWKAAKQFSMSGSDGKSAAVQFQVLFSAEWLGSVQAQGTNDSAHQSSAAKEFANMSLLENVELEVTLRFGQRQLSLREIGELRSGSVVELDKHVQDPAELLLGERVVARGEVVIVDGNYGLRVTEVV